jgi:hypothetical protein
MKRRWRSVMLLALLAVLLAWGWVFWQRAPYSKYCITRYCDRCGLIETIGRHIVVWQLPDDEERVHSNSIHRWQEARLGPCKEHHWVGASGGGQTGTLARSECFDMFSSPGNFAGVGLPGRLFDESFDAVQPRLPKEWVNEYADFLLLDINPDIDGSPQPADRLHLLEDIGRAKEDLAFEALNKARDSSEAGFTAWWTAEARPVILKALGTATAQSQ